MPTARKPAWLTRLLAFWERGRWSIPRNFSKNLYTSRKYFYFFIAKVYDACVHARTPAHPPPPAGARCAGDGNPHSR